MNKLFPLEKTTIKKSDWIPVMIEQIGIGRIKDRLYISNRRRNLWIFSLFNGYKQLGVYDVVKPHKYYEQQYIFVKKARVRHTRFGITWEANRIFDIKPEKTTTMDVTA